MRTNLSSTLSLSELASQFEVSHGTFSRRFTNATVVSASHYWQKVRVETVKYLLSSSNLSIQDIAFQVGYQSQGQLTRLFKKQLNLTPRDYRALVRKKIFSQ